MDETNTTTLSITVALLLIVGCGENKQPPDPDVRDAIDSATVVDTGPAPPSLRHERYPDALTAVEQVLARTKPRVVGFGEFHQQQGTAAIRSTLERFSHSLLPALAPRTSDLVVEAWISEGGCGATEKAVVEEVEQISKRPEKTEDENLILLKRAKQLGVAPHILEMSCKDYERVHGGDAGVDYVAMLELVSQRLEAAGKQLLAAGTGEAGGKLIAVFSGAIHNDVAPAEDFASFAYGSALREAAAGRYVEIDLYVPEFVLASKSARDEPWFPLIGELASPDGAFLIERGPGSYIVLFRKGVLAAEPPDKGGGK